MSRAGVLMKFAAVMLDTVSSGLGGGGGQTCPLRLLRNTCGVETYRDAVMLLTTTSGVEIAPTDAPRPDEPVFGAKKERLVFTSD
jgi:hypothetical protein